MGLIRPSGSLDSVTSRGFTGQEHLSEVGLIHYNARLYDPLVGRFTSADSIVPHPGDPQSYNRYAYVRNRPLSATDPSGHQDALPTIDIGAAWAPFIGGGAGSQAYLSFLYGKIFGASYYGASILPGLPGFAVGNPVQYLIFQRLLRAYTRQLETQSFARAFRQRANLRYYLTPAPAAAEPDSPVAAGFARGSNAYGYVINYPSARQMWGETLLGIGQGIVQGFFDFAGGAACGVAGECSPTSSVFDEPR